MARRSTIGDNPLDAVIPVAPRQEPVAAPEPVPPKPEARVKERLTIHIPLPLIDRVKNAVYWTPGMTMADLAEFALEDYVDRMEAERGEAFPSRNSELKRGRPIR